MGQVQNGPYMGTVWWYGLWKLFKWHVRNTLIYYYIMNGWANKMKALLYQHKCKIVLGFRLAQRREIVSPHLKIFIQLSQQSLEMLRRYYQYGINKQELVTAYLPCIERMSQAQQDKFGNCAWRPAHHRIGSQCSKLSCASLKYSSTSLTTVRILVYCAVKLIFWGELFATDGCGAEAEEVRDEALFV